MISTMMPLEARVCICGATGCPHMCNTFVIRAESYYEVPELPKTKEPPYRMQINNKYNKKKLGRR